MRTGSTANPALKGSRFNKNTAETLMFYVKENPNGCMEWTGAIRDNGYASATVDYKSILVHRYMYEQKVGPIPKGMHIDHLCRNRRCVNVNHMEVVTPRENVLRGIGISALNAKKTHCLRGHALFGDNIYIPPNRPNRRYCRICQRSRDSKYIMDVGGTDR